MILRLPVTGTALRYIHASKRRMEHDLALVDRKLQDLSDEPMLATSRLIQAGRWYEEELSLEQADAIIDAEIEGGVVFASLFNALIQAYHGKRPVLEVEPEEPESLTLVTDETPKKSRPNGAAGDRVS